MSKENHPYKPDASGIFETGGDSHRKVVFSLLEKSYGAAAIARATGLPEKAVRELEKEWRAKRK